MKTETTLRFKDPNANVDAAMKALTESYGIDLKGRLIGGFYFETDMQPADILDALATEGFNFTDLDNIEFKPVT